MATRTLQQLIPGRETSDGAGVRLRRSIGQGSASRTDPFLMLDEFGTDNPDDYIAGFPPHPHRGFETVTIMLDGHMRHQDHLGNVGELKSGGVQWMTAGRGIIHSEMPMQSEGRMRGFQLWINLPAAEKMKPAAYRDIQADQVPRAPLAGGGSVRVIAGTLAESLAAGAAHVAGPIQGLTTDPRVLDLRLGARERFELTVPADYTACGYVFEGEARFGEDLQLVGTHNGALLGPGEKILVTAGSSGAAVLLLVAKPLREPIVQYGPFVMNTREQIEQAVNDYNRGLLAREAAVKG
jgi:quercetin 2,3-dioxygenase